MAGFDEVSIQGIKEHLFIKEHELIGGTGRFDPDYMIAQSWQRLADGRNIQPHDRTLLLHEQLEVSLMKQGLSQDAAHRQASGKYNYNREANEYYALLEKY